MKPKFLGRLRIPISRRRAAVLGGLALAAAAPVASAAPTPQVMPAITFPLDLDSIVIAIGAGGAIMLGLWAGLWVAFRLTKRLIQRVGSAV